MEQAQQSPINGEAVCQAVNATVAIKENLRQLNMLFDNMNQDEKISFLMNSFIKNYVADFDKKEISFE